LKIVVIINYSLQRALPKGEKEWDQSSVSDKIKCNYIIIELTIRESRLACCKLLRNIYHMTVVPQMAMNLCQNTSLECLN